MSKKNGNKSSKVKAKPSEAKSKAAKAPKPVANSAKARESEPTKDKRPSGLDGAVRVLKEVGKPLNCKAMVNMMIDKGYWKTAGKTPWATLYSAILREITEKKGDSRFKKVDRGLFVLTGKGGEG